MTLPSVPFRGTAISNWAQISAPLRVGRDLQGAVMSTAAVYTYSRSKGLFAGVSLEGAIIATQKTANERYYGQSIGARSILAGDVPPPPGAQRLVEILSGH